VAKRGILMSAAGAAAASLLLFSVMSWPLARQVTEAIPSSAQNLEHPAFRAMIPGDQLQLLYHFDLVRDMLHGRIPWFRNPYEFNQGDDDAGYRPGAYFLPMSGVYAVLAERLGQAAGWNLTLWLSVAFSAFFSWRWLRRFTDDRLAAALGTGLILLAPFRWISLFGGSPAGIALMWLPLLAWCLDAAVNRPTLASGFGAGAAMLLLFWADLQTFYLAMVFLPVLLAISLLGHEDLPPWRRWWRPVPGAVVFLALLAVFYLWRRQYLDGSTLSGGRSLCEVLVFSPRPRGFWLGGMGADDWIFLGFSVTLTLAVAWAVLLAQAAGRAPGQRDGRRIGLLLILLAALLGGACLALGMNGPVHGAALKAARAVLPHYSMIRQPAKIMALLPLWIGWVLAAGLTRRPTDGRGWRRLKGGLATAGLAGLALEVIPSYPATLCRLEPTQAAYERVARTAALDRDGPGRALALPLWPGDSMDTTVPLYFAQQYDLRLINGYSPVVSPDYVEQVFHRLESLNQGEATEAQIDFLLERRIRFLLLHENLFPEKVSPFPVGETLRRLKGHPRIQFLEQDGPVHAFRLLTPGEARVGRVPGSRVFPAAFPARRREAELQREGQGGRTVADESASGGAAWQGAGGEESPAWFATRPARVAAADDLAWRVRLRGTGPLRTQMRWGDDWRPEDVRELSAPDWQWLSLPITPPPAAYGQTQLKVTSGADGVQVDVVLLTAGPWPGLDGPFHSMRIPAAAFFRAGFTDPDGVSVTLRRDHDPDVELFYGPRLPLPPGRVSVELLFSSDAPDGADLGRLAVRFGNGGIAATAPVRAGKPARLDVPVESNLPFTAALHYNRAHDMTLHALAIDALPDAAPGEDRP
jgi:hypothetical protein